jgi:hypothetical protein
MDILTYLHKVNLDNILFAYNHSNALQHLVNNYDKKNTNNESKNKLLKIKKLNEECVRIEKKIDIINDNILKITNEINSVWMIFQTSKKTKLLENKELFKEQKKNLEIDLAKIKKQISELKTNN